MLLHFYKYQGAGNDFILLDNREKKISLTRQQIEFLCDRKFGIGADGLMLLETIAGYDFHMVYFNSDGNESSMCGNGGRCITAFANKVGVIKNEAKFLAVDGPHHAELKNDWVSLEMKNVDTVEKGNDYFFLDTGSPHYVKFVKDIEEFPVVEEARKIRYNERFKEKGTNVNFIEKKEDKLLVRTYERGVENETLACGTGVTAASLVAALSGLSTEKNGCKILTPGGELFVKFNSDGENKFNSIRLEGPAKFVFDGHIEI
ncbi:MAG: diaminopimelate epimerase [Bacteroidia bacterium]|nr:diaminopimelate epimerase [Bacteroidia bacterium]